MASASSFMITGWKFAGYLGFVMVYSLINGLIVDFLVL